MTSSTIEKLQKTRDEIRPGSVWDYVGGGSYRIKSVELNATDYEETHKVDIVVVYEQLVAGSFPAGQIWVRSLNDFQGDIEKDGTRVKKFTQNP